MTTRNDIERVLWKACDSFRGKIDSSRYKDYILSMLFVKYLSDVTLERRALYMEQYDGDERRVERAMSRERFSLDRESTFDYLYENRTDTEIGQKINVALSHIEDHNSGKLRNVFRAIDFNSQVDFGDVREKNATLRNLLEDFHDLDLRPGQLGSADIIGDAYEYMIANFASDAGKKGGEFFTPSQVSELVASLVKPQENDRIYDPTCGSGGLLLKAYKKVPSGKVAVYGQELNAQTWALCTMNMFLHGVDDARIWQGDTLSNPQNLEDDKLMKFQVVVANPPFSLDKWDSGFLSKAGPDEKGKKPEKMTAALDEHHRFDWGVPPSSKGDYAFVLHMLNSLDAENGRMAVVLPHGVLFRGASEGKIRKQLIEMNLLDAVIGLPANLFYGTGIPACILVFKKGRTRDDVLFIDASGEGSPAPVRKEKKKAHRGLVWVLVLVTGAAIAAGSLLLLHTRQEKQAQLAAAQQAQVQEQQNQYEALMEQGTQLCETDPEQALGCFEQAQALYPEESAPYISYAYALYCAQDYERCISYIEDELGLGKAYDIEAQSQLSEILGAAYFECDDYAAAASFFRLSTAGGDITVNAQRDYAVSLGRLGDIDAADEILSQMYAAGASGDVTDYVQAEIDYAKTAIARRWSGREAPRSETPRQRPSRFWRTGSKPTACAMTRRSGRCWRWPISRRTTPTPPFRRATCARPGSASTACWSLA